MLYKLDTVPLEEPILHMAIQTGSHFTLHVVGARVIRMRGLLLDKLVFAVELSN